MRLGPYAPVNVNSWGGGQAYDRGLSDHIESSNNSTSLRHHSGVTNSSNIDLLGGDSCRES